LTAQVAVLNASGIALASDSAVTVTGGKQSRSYQSADKIFPIAGVPLAVLHSGNTALWGVPWQLLVEIWSQGRGATHCASVEADAQDFLTWLSQQSALVNPANQEDRFRWTFRDYLLAVRGAIRQELGLDEDDSTAGYVDGDRAAQIDAAVDGYIEGLQRREDFKGMEGVDARAVRTRLKSKLDEDLAWVFDDTPRTSHLDEQAALIAELLVHKAQPFSTDAVLAFAGYGEDEYFPSLYQCTISGAREDRVRLYDDSHARVDASNRVCITPLGLTEAIHMFLRGTSPKYRSAAHEVLDSAVTPSGALDPSTDANTAHERLDGEFDSSGRSSCRRCWTSSRLSRCTRPCDWPTPWWGWPRCGSLSKAIRVSAAQSILHV
jgi:hypothetical protein